VNHSRASSRHPAVAGQHVNFHILLLVSMLSWQLAAIGWPRPAGELMPEDLCSWLRHLRINMLIDTSAIGHTSIGTFAAGQHGHVRKF
jgi:hypothetical protein